MPNTTLYVAVDASTSEPFEFITKDFDALSEWLDDEDNRTYYESSLSDEAEIHEMMAE